MAFVVPIIANRRRNGRSSTGAVIAGLIIFLIFGIMFFLFFNRSGVFGFQFNVIFIIGGFSVFFMIIIVVSFAVVATSKTYKPPRNRTFNEHYRIPQKQANILNPYKVPRSTEGQNKEIFGENNQRDIPIVGKIIYCRYCGAKRDKDAIFCHMCGIKL